MFKKLISIILLLGFIGIIGIVTGLIILKPNKVEIEYTKTSTPHQLKATIPDEVKLRRIPKAGILGGICAGFAYYTKTPIWLWRAGTFVSFLTGSGEIVYVVLWIFMPKYNDIPADFNIRTTN